MYNVSFVADWDMASVYQFWHSIFLYVIFHFSTKINVFFYWTVMVGGGKFHLLLCATVNIYIFHSTACSNTVMVYGTTG